MARHFLKNVSVFALGTLIAQLIGIAVMPIITRIYGPETYGLLGTFNAWFAIVAVFSTGRMQLAYIAHQSDVEKAQEASNGSLLITLGLTLVLLLGTSLGHFVFGAPYWILFYAPMALIVGISVLTESYCVAHKRYKNVAAGRVSRPLTNGGLQVSLGLWQPTILSLIISFFSGYLMAAIVFAVSSPFQFPRLRSVWSSGIRGVRNNWGYVGLSMPADLINTGLRMLPATLFPLKGWTSEVAFFFIAYKLLYLPIVLIAQNFFHVYYQKISEFRAQQKSSLNQAVRLTMGLSGLAAVGLVVLWLFAEPIFAFCFGEKWVEAGTYARILGLWLAVHFVYYPLTVYFDIYKKQVYPLAISGVTLVVQVVLFQYADNALSAIWTFTLTNIVAIGLSMVLSLGIAASSKADS